METKSKSVPYRTIKTRTIEVQTPSRSTGKWDVNARRRLTNTEESYAYTPYRYGGTKEPAMNEITNKVTNGIPHRGSEIKKKIRISITEETNEYTNTTSEDRNDKGNVRIVEKTNPRFLKTNKLEFFAESSRHFKRTMELCKPERITNFEVFHCPKITDNDLLFLQYFSNLHTLKLPELYKITNKSLEALSKLTNLTHLDLHFCKKLTDDSLTIIQQLPLIKTLNLDSTKVTDKTIKQLSTLTNLSELSLCCTTITDQSLQTISLFTKLTTLNLMATDITDGGIPMLQSLRNLIILTVSGNDFENQKITDKTLAHLKKLSGLQELHVGGHLTNRGVKHLRSLMFLKKLELESNQITSEGVSVLTCLKKLKISEVVPGTSIVPARTISKSQKKK